MKFASGTAGSDANALMMFASTALRYCVAQSGNMASPIDEAGSGDQFVLLNGFHNSPADLSENDNEVEDYVNASLNDGIGDNWVDIMAYRNGYLQECTVSSTLSSSEANADLLYYYGGFKDYKNTGTHSQHWYYYDCSPSECDGTSEIEALPWC